MLTSASPATWNGHYCGGKLLESSFSEKFEPCCPVQLHHSEETQVNQRSCDFELKSFDGYDSSTTKDEVATPALISCIDYASDFPRVATDYSENLLPRSNAPPLYGRIMCEKFDRWIL
ncbi:MAG: hypothetical protein HWE14_01200 [Flavobacteriia bacterium]|nr:hypothetical protein [Flavobacteriia bacterium]